MIKKQIVAVTLALALGDVSAQWGSVDATVGLTPVAKLGDKFDPKNPTEVVSEETLLKEQ